jgi:hypothetical protein
MTTESALNLKEREGQEVETGKGGQDKQTADVRYSLVQAEGYS